MTLELPTIGEDSTGADFYADACHIRLAMLSPASAEGSRDRRALLNDCTPERAEHGLDQLRPANIARGDQPLTGAAWRLLPSTYVRGSQDQMPEAVVPAFFEQDMEKGGGGRAYGRLAAR